MTDLNPPAVIIQFRAQRDNCYLQTLPYLRIFVRFYMKDGNMDSKFTEMENNILGGMAIVKDIVAVLSSGRRSRDEDERLRMMMREVMSERSNNTLENELMNRMMQLVEHTVSKQTELQAAAQERDEYKTKLDELNRSMALLLQKETSRDTEGLSPRQRKLAKMLEDLKEMRSEHKRNEEKGGGNTSQRGGGGGGGRGRGRGRGAEGGAFRQRARSRPREETLPWEDDPKLSSFEKKPHEGQGAYGKFDKKNRGGGTGGQEHRPFNQNYGKNKSGFVVVDHDDCKPRNYHQNDQFQRGPPQMTFEKRHPPFVDQKNPGHSNRGYDPQGPQFMDQKNPGHFNRGYDPQGPQFVDQKNPGYFNRAYDPQVPSQMGGYNSGYEVPVQGPNRGTFQHRGTFQQRGQMHNRGQFQPRGQGHPHRGQFNQNRGQFHNKGDGQKREQKDLAKELNLSQFTAEEVEAIKSVLKQQQQSKKQENPETKQNTSKSAFKKKKRTKKPKNTENPKTDDDHDDESSSDDDEVSGDTTEKGGKEESSSTTGATNIATPSDGNNSTGAKKKNLKKNKDDKPQGSTAQKSTGSTPLEVYVASGLDLSTPELLDEKLKGVVLITTDDDGHAVTFVPTTVRAMVEFKNRYPNAVATIAKSTDK
ncbi:dentin sialophosphoprotein-like isoform X2 [Periplaneta americana]|uniref:dentin sialophosphoprotein-like isoform X2 n=1 Tax=Periplaneta americana TaxID=6978 RepID=UPI0037E85489